MRAERDQAEQRAGGQRLQRGRQRAAHELQPVLAAARVHQRQRDRRHRHLGRAAALRLLPAKRARVCTG